MILFHLNQVDAKILIDFIFFMNFLIKFKNKCFINFSYCYQDLFDAFNYQMFYD